MTTQERSPKFDHHRGRGAGKCPFLRSSSARPWWAKGYFVTIGETYGASQRGGSVMSHIRLSCQETAEPLDPSGQSRRGYGPGAGGGPAGSRRVTAIGRPWSSPIPGPSTPWMSPRAMKSIRKWRKSKPPCETSPANFTSFRRRKKRWRWAPPSSAT